MWRRPEPNPQPVNADPKSRGTCRSFLVQVPLQLLQHSGLAQHRQRGRTVHSSVPWLRVDAVFLFENHGCFDRGTERKHQLRRRKKHTLCSVHGRLKFLPEFHGLQTPSLWTKLWRYKLPEHIRSRNVRGPSSTTSSRPSQLELWACASQRR